MNKHGKDNSVAFTTCQSVKQQMQLERKIIDQDNIHIVRLKQCSLITIKITKPSYDRKIEQKNNLNLNIRKHAQTRSKDSRN